MITFVTDKKTIINAVLLLLPTDEIEMLDSAMKTWWTNIRRTEGLGLTGGLGLTEHGDNMFQLAQLESYDFEIMSDPKIGLLFMSIMINRELTCPHFMYYENKKRYIRIYDSRIAMIIALEGSVNDYLSKLVSRKKEINNDRTKA